MNTIPDHRRTSKPAHRNCRSARSIKRSVQWVSGSGEETENGTTTSAAIHAAFVGGSEGTRGYCATKTEALDGALENVAWYRRYVAKKAG